MAGTLSRGLGLAWLGLHRAAPPALLLTAFVLISTNTLSHARVHAHAPCPTQARMASTSNQETFRCSNLNGRLVFDVLRQVDTTQAKESF